MPVLLVEDDENDIFLLQSAFAAAGISNPIEVVHDGEQAIEYLAGEGAYADCTRYPLPCLILLDLKMPRKDGLEVLHWLRQESRLPYIPVVLLTSSGHISDVQQAYDLGVNAFVVKPFSADERLELARCLKDFWLHFNQIPSRTRGHPANAPLQAPG